jgi:hypothetical protein
MQIRVKKKVDLKTIRVKASGSIKEVLINEDIFNPKDESVSVCFRGKDSSGIIDFTPDEIEGLYASVKNRMHLIKGVGKIVIDKK